MDSFPVLYHLRYLIRLYLFSIGNPDCNPATWSNYDSSCCTVENPCGLGEGDCDQDNQCIGNFVCGYENCGSEFPRLADCCSGR